MPETGPEIALWLARKWQEHFARALEAMADENPGGETDAHSLTPEDIGTPETIFWRRHDFNAAASPSCWIGAAPKTWQEIGGRVLKAAGVDETDLQSVRETYVELLNQSLSALAQSISERLGIEITCKAGPDGPPDASSSSAYLSRFTLAGTECPLLVVFSESFPAAFKKEVETRAADVENTSRAVMVPQSGGGKSIDLLRDVELPVSVSFGRAQLALKDVLKLTTGSIIELNRAVSEPVEIIINNCVIARGEVVVVEGNFGVRIRQVISRPDRVKSLR